MTTAEEILDRQMNPQNNRAGGNLSIRVSKLVGRSAADYAKEHFAEDSVDSHYAYRGNAFSDAALRPVTPYRELRVEHALTNEVSLTGHLDGILAHVPDDKAYALVEFKTHEEATAQKVEIARRQGTLYLAMAEAMRAAGIPALQPARWAPADCQPFEFGDLHPAGVHVAVATWHGRRHEWFPSVLLEDTLQFYLAKARAILKSIQENDLTPALEWDAANLTEFARPLEHMGAPAMKLDDLLPAYDAARADEDAGKVKKDNIKAEIMRTLQENGLDRAEAAGFKVTRVVTKGKETADVKALKEAGLDQFIKVSEPSSYPLVKRV